MLDPMLTVDGFFDNEILTVLNFFRDTFFGAGVPLPPFYPFGA